MKKKLTIGGISAAIILVAYAALPTSAKTAKDLASPPFAPMTNTGTVATGGKILETTLSVEMVEGEIRNPHYGSGASDHVELRGYRCVSPKTLLQSTSDTQEFNFDHCISGNGFPGTEPEKTESAILIAPMLEVSPGDQLTINVQNNLPKNSDEHCGKDDSDINTPHCFNSTNLHTHGLWVDPDTEDDVLTTIAPGDSKPYTYSIRKDHPAGTFWYHPHVHGSTAIQVGSGMVGALIIRGDRKPVTHLLKNDNQPAATAAVPIHFQRGDLDTLLSPFCMPGTTGRNDCSTNGMTASAGSPSVEERVMLFQQIQYYCGEPVEVMEGGKTVKKPPLCTQNNPGKIDDYDNLGPGGWASSLRYTSINGIVIPQYRATANRLQRLRMIHGGVRDTLNVRVYKLKKNVDISTDKNLAETLSALAADKSNSRLDGAALPQFMVATDGLTLAHVIEQNQTILQPGYRADILLNFSEGGSYVVFDGETPADASVNQEAPSRQVLAFFNVDASDKKQAGDEQKKSPREWMRSSLLSLSEIDGKYEESVKAKIKKDLKTGDGVMSLDSFTAHQPITEAQLTTQKIREVEFNIDTKSTPTRFEINRRAYTGTSVDQILKFNEVEEWHLTSAFAGHPFHIHVNPFEIIAIYNQQGVDVSGSRDPRDFTVLDHHEFRSAKDGANGKQMTTAITTKTSEEDLQYRNLKGAFKDTIFVKPGYRVVIRSHYAVFAGDFVLHCHILDHEDQGMMQYVRICEDGEEMNACKARSLRGHGHPANPDTSVHHNH